MSDKKQRIGKLIYRIESGNDVANRDLKSVLTSDEFEMYESDWEQSQDFHHAKMFDKSTRYEELLAKGDFFYNRAESNRFKNSRELHNKAQDFYDKALEALREDIGMNPSISASYDRSADDASLSQAGMPRHRSSKSINNEAKNHQRLDKRQFKLKHLKSSLANFDNRKEGKELGRNEGSGISDSEKLKNLMKRFRAK